MLLIPINALVATRVKKLKVRRRLPPVMGVKLRPSFLTCVDNNHLANSVYVDNPTLSFIHGTGIDWTPVLCRGTAVRRTDEFQLSLEEMGIKK